MMYEQLVKALRSASTISSAWEKLMLDAAAAIEALETEIRESMQKCAECGDEQEQKVKEQEGRNMRLIDADALREIWVCLPGHDFEPSSFVYSIDIAPTVEPASPWHRVEEELPKDGEFGEIVLACNDVGTVNAAFLSSYGKWYAANNTMYDSWTWMPNVTHWMPFPEPPKEDA